MRKTDLTEEHVLLRVPEELASRVHAVARPKDKSQEVIEFISEGGDKSRDVVFKIGDDKYWAKLRDLPTVVETMKTKKSDSGVFYKSSEVGQVLEVSNIKVGEKPRPEVSHLADDGLTPPMAAARSERFKRMDRSLKHGLSQDMSKDSERLKLVHKMDNELNEIVENLSKQKTEFVHEELVEMEPFMHYWDSKTIINQGSDNFLSESRKAYDLAYEQYLKKTGGKVRPRPKTTQMLSDPPTPFPFQTNKTSSESSSHTARTHALPPPPPPATSGSRPSSATLPSSSPNSSGDFQSSPPAPSPPSSVAPSPPPPANLFGRPQIASVTSGLVPTVAAMGGATPGTPGGVATPNTAGGLTPGVPQPSPSPIAGMPQPSPSPIPGEESNPLVQALRKRLHDAAARLEETKVAYEAANRKYKREKNIQLKKRFEGPKDEARKACEVAQAEHAALLAELKSIGS